MRNVRRSKQTMYATSLSNLRCNMRDIRRNMRVIRRNMQTMRATSISNKSHNMQNTPRNMRDRWRNVCSLQRPAHVRNMRRNHNMRNARGNIRRQRNVWRIMFTIYRLFMNSR